MRNNKNCNTRDRKIKRQEFIKKNYEVCKAAFENGYPEGYKLLNGRIVISLARTELGYSHSTVNMDIYRSLRHEFEEYQSFLN